ncbi:endonuclease/exonuclease/phosphatase family protein [Paludibacter sp. 221]|uniref:endonuclease/exonuclease/phosphatase family protein n=1 Tax=Paludibacter sp. 221 TaxID=2302939 RepID=UPI0013D6DCBC|nr:endonuclease/exonuclease/phosphatase family protein [Paludibacter sp. 221]
MSPEKILIPSYLELVLPVFVVANVLFVVFWLVFKKWYFLFSLVFLVLSYSSLKILFPVNINVKKKEVSENAFTMLSYNTWVLGRMKKHTAESPNQVVQYVLDCDADVICLQEFVVSENDDYLTHRDITSMLKKKYPYQHIYYKDQNKRRSLGIATFSKYPIINKQAIDYTSRQNSAIFSDIVVKKDTLRFINCHLESNRLTEKDKAMPLELRKNFDTESLSNVAIQLSRKLGVAYKTRAVQADIVAEVVSNSPYKTVVCGDFNDVPLSYAYTKVRGEQIDVFEELGFGFGSTFTESLYKFRIDYVFCNKNIIPLKFKIDKVKYSDHYPLLCTLEINNN